MTRRQRSVSLHPAGGDDLGFVHEVACAIASATVSSDTSRRKDAVHAFGLHDEDLAAWQESGLPDDAFDEWLTDRVARRPTGSRAREVYGAEDVHDFARRAILEELALGPGDRLLDVGCGGGLLLRDALATGASATGLDHSQEMAELARERAPGAEVVLGTAERLPFGDDTFSAAAMSIVLFFLDDPVGVLRECRRVLRPGGRLAVYTTGPELRGTPAAPEPIASLGHFYEDEELAELARRAELHAVAVRNDGGGQLLTAHA
jgi:SAM-dependent methyltransferase